MHTLILSLLLAGSGSGIGHRPGSSPLPTAMPIPVPGGLLASLPALEWPTARRLRIVGMHWTETTAGVGSTMTYAVTVDGDTACSITVDCNSTGLVSKACDAEAPAGSTLAVVVSTDACLVGNPAGTLMLVVE